MWWGAEGAEGHEFQSTPPRGERRAVLAHDVDLVRVSIHAPARGATRHSLRFPRRRRVSIHAPARGATRAPVPVITGPLVSIHAPARGATSRPRRACASRRGFNPRPRAGSDAQAPLGRPVEIGVSIHAPARGATSRRRSARSGLGCFNPRPRAGSDESLGLVGHGFRVSIHAPARGATTTPRRACASRPVSIHAPARGATWCSTPPLARRESFNPRPRAGSDRGAQHRRRGDATVSIHAPARGATLARRRRGGERDVSIHAPARGATGTIGNTMVFSNWFQSTPPRGERLRAI